MQLEVLVHAAPSLQKLISQDLPIRSAWQLKKLVDICNPMLEFYSQEIQKIILKDDAGTLQRELELLDVPELDNIPIIELSLDTSLKLSAADIKVLEPFIAFMGETS